MAKKKLVSILAALLLFGINAHSQDNPRGSFYHKDHVKGFLSLKADYRELRTASIDKLNEVLFADDFYLYGLDTAGNLVSWREDRLGAYGRFAAEIQGLHLEIGAQYGQFLTWINVNTMPTQVSRAPSMPPADRLPILRDVKWFSYGADWMFGWMLFPEKAPIQIIPSLGVGMSLLNLKLAQNYGFNFSGSDESSFEPYILSDEYISSVGKTALAEIELRLRMFSGLSAGFYGGYRTIFYDDIILQKDGASDPATNYYIGTGEISGDSWYFGGKLTFTLSSTAEKRHRSRL